MRRVAGVLGILAVLAGVTLAGRTALAGGQAESEQPQPPASFAVDTCDTDLNRCMLACEKANPEIAGDMLCTGCGFNCYTDHKACLAKAWYEKLFGSKKQK